MDATELMTGAWALPGWVAGAAAALILVLLVLAFSRNDMLGTVNAVFRYGLVLAGVILTWNFIAQGVNRDRFLERQILESRAADLTSRALAPGSPLACLDNIVGADVERACETALFATPVNVAAATSYTAARLALLADGMAFARAKDQSYGTALAGLRRSLAADRFGLVAHVLAMRDGCTVDRCAAYALFREPGRIRSNLASRTFSGYLARYAANWPSGNDAVAAVNPLSAPTSVPPGPAGLERSQAAPPGKRVSSDLFFPSSDSIPAVSIMTPEPPLPKASAPASGKGGKAAPAARAKGASRP